MLNKNVQKYWNMTTSGKIIPGIAMILLFKLLFFTSGCNDPYKPIDYSKMMKEEIELLDEYLDLDPDGLFQNSLDTIQDFSVDERWIYMEMEAGNGDSVKIGSNVSLRYSLYAIDRNNQGLPVRVMIESTNESDYPRVMNVQPDGWMSGVYYGLIHMKVNGKSLMIFPSSLGSVNRYGYTSLILELKVTAMES